MTTPITTWQQLLMASVSTPDQAAAAHAAGWRTFRVDAEPAPGEVVCPASKEAGQKTQCDRCALCSGALAPVALRALAARARMASIMPAWRARVRPMLRTLGAKANGVELWRGPSALDGSPVVVVATGIRKATSNTKTADMIQTWILPQDINPHEAAKTGQDVGVCGDCVHRPSTARSTGHAPCYVRTWEAPRSVHDAWMRGRYPAITPTQAGALFDGARFRCGSWGDPYAAPLAVWAEVTAGVASRTGYTAQWRRVAPVAPADRRASIVIKAH